MELRFFFLTFATEMYLLEGDENVLFFLSLQEPEKGRILLCRNEFTDVA